MVNLNPIRMKSWDSSNIGIMVKRFFRRSYASYIEGDSLTYPQLVCQYVGVSLDEDEYFSILHTQVNDSLW